MKKKSRNATKKEPRNLGVTVVAGALAFGFGVVAVDAFMNPDSMWIIGVAAGIVAAICLGVAVYGRKSLFKMLAELIFRTV